MKAKRSVWKRHPVAIAAVLVFIAVGGVFVYMQLALQSAIHQVGAAYGDPHPRVVRNELSQTVNPPDIPMYGVIITGNFHKGHEVFHLISFSVLVGSMNPFVVHPILPIPGVPLKIPGCKECSVDGRAHV